PQAADRRHHWDAPDADAGARDGARRAARRSCRQQRLEEDDLRTGRRRRREQIGEGADAGRSAGRRGDIPRPAGREHPSLEDPMPSSIDLPANAMVALTRDSFVSLRAALFRDVGANAAALLQEAGFAGGPAVFAAFGAWLGARGQSAPETLAASEFAPLAAQFFHESGWGSLHLD